MIGGKRMKSRFLIITLGFIIISSPFSVLATTVSTANGSLSGYITDTHQNPIEGAKVTITCGNNSFECYSNETGYYFKGDIPVIFCVWNISSYKIGYEPSYYEMSIGENSTHNFTLTFIEIIDLDISVLRGPTYSSPIVKVKNVGNIPVHNIRIIDVNVTNISGMVVYNNRESLLTTSLDPNEVVYGTINSWFFGLGVFIIIVTVSCNEGVFLSETTNGLIIFSFVFIP